MNEHQPTHLDAAVIGAGIAGIYTLHQLRNKLGLRTRAFDRASGIGGTWFWNRYPGVRADTQSLVYRYSFDEEMFDEWDWSSRYATGDEMLTYLQAVVDRHDLGRDIQLDTSIELAEFDEDQNVWRLTTTTGQTFTATYLVSAVGVLSAINTPNLPGQGQFRGRIVHTAQWPTDLDLTGLRVGVIGTGSTGTQFITASSKVVAHLTVFQRSAQYVVPSGSSPLSPEVVGSYRGDFDQAWQEIRATRIACGFTESDVPAMSVSGDERRRVFQDAWDAGGGFQFMFGTFADIASDRDANAAAASFIRDKIHETVNDPQTAQRLTPTDLYAKRPIATDNYYATYNRENVELVSLGETPITGLTPAGVRTSDGVEHPLDVLVYATGFEAVQGSYDRMRILGREGESLSVHWAQGPSAYLGMGVAGFPNLFMVLGPTSVFSNLPPGIETQVEWIAGLIKETRARGSVQVEATLTAEREWGATCDQIAAYTLFPQVKSWIFGSNVPGRAPRTLFYFGGLGEYRRTLTDIADAGYEGFTFRTAPIAAPALA